MPLSPSRRPPRGGRGTPPRNADRGPPSARHQRDDQTPSPVNESAQSIDMLVEQDDAAPPPRVGRSLLYESVVVGGESGTAWFEFLIILPQQLSILLFFFLFFFVSVMIFARSTPSTVLL